MFGEQISVGTPLIRGCREDFAHTGLAGFLTVCHTLDDIQLCLFVMKTAFLEQVLQLILF